MADYLGPIQITDPPTIGPFPLLGDYGSGIDYTPPIAIHSFDQPGLKTEQRFVLGSGQRRFRVRRDHLSCDESDKLEAHFIQAQGLYAQFNYNCYGPDGVETYLVRYENPSITFPQLIGLVTGDPGVTLLEVAAGTPTYNGATVVTRFPDSTFANALRAGTQHVVPLITIAPRDGSTPVYVSNQRISVNGTLYLPRLLDWQGIQQSIGESSDGAKFTFGNADGVWAQLVNQVNLLRAVVRFRLYHVESNYIVNLWSGRATPWSFDTSGKFYLGASDGVFQLSLGYPVRSITRSCWKVYKGRYCPSTSSLPDCPKSWEACNDRGVPMSFGGTIVPAQSIRIKDSTTGILGWGRSSFTSVTVSDDTIYQRALQEIFTDQYMKVTADIIAGRDENSFYAALGLLGEGPLGGYSPYLNLHQLDGFIPHDPLREGGFRGVIGTDPANAPDYLGISQAVNGRWDVVPPGSTYTAGMAFAEIRRTDDLGLQLAPLTEHTMTVTVAQGIGGWVWTAPGARHWSSALSNCVWVAVNVYLRALGLRFDQAREFESPVGDMEAVFDVSQAVAAANICDLVVSKLVGTGFEYQFPFRGILKERKPLKDWLTEILNCCLGFYTFVDGKLWIGIRENSSVLAGNAFTRATILYQSLQAVPIAPNFNWFDVQFGDEEFEYALNKVTAYDITAAQLQGDVESPEYTNGTMTLVGVSNKSQASRIAITRLREENGGWTATEELNARNLSFRTTILGLQTMVGDIVSMTHDSLPTGYCEGRVSRWTLNPDFSIDIQTTATTDSMYDYTAGPKPDDVPADPVPPELLPSPDGLAWLPNDTAPFAGDPLYPDGLERTFGLWQDYTIGRQGEWNPALWVRGEMTVNQYIELVQPRIAGLTLSSGGQLQGGQTIYFEITVHDAQGRPAVGSNVAAIWLASGLTNQKVSLALAPPPSPAGTWPTWKLWAGTDRRALALQSTTSGDVPLSVDFPGPVHHMTQGAPEGGAERVKIAAKHVWHSGVAGVLVTGVTAPNQIQSNDFMGSTDNWVGCYLSALADFSDGSVPLWNFAVTAFDSATGTLTVSPDCVRADPADSVQEGDVLIVRSMARTVSTDLATITDPLWNNFIARNQFNSPGLAPGDEVGRVLRVLRGPGQGQFRRITANTATSITVAPPFTISPTAQSVMIVEAPDWVYSTESSTIDVAAAGAGVELRLRVDNLRDQVALVAGFLIDRNGNATDEQFAVMREIYIFGQPPTVRVIGPDPLAPDGNPWQAFETDHTIRVDTSANDITLNLPPLYVYQGRTLVIWNDGGNTVTVTAFAGETLWDGTTSVILDTQGTSLKITAA